MDERADLRRAEERWPWMREELNRLEAAAQLRRLVPSKELGDGWVEREGRRLLNLASNHYLGLEHRLDAGRLEQWTEEAGEALRTGATASRLIVGTDPQIERLEAEFAAFKGTQRCLVFGSGYLANVGIISALAGRGGLVYSDRLNHASITDGIVLSRAEHCRYRHRDLDQLETMLRRAEPGKRKLIVTDAVFSMDGTLAPLEEIVRLKERYGAMLMVDEAHSGGVYGEEGQGLAHALGLTGRIDIHMGTFSKAYGAYGAYAAGDELLIRYLINTARSLIFTTALPPIVVAAIRHNWRTARAEGWRREALRRKAERVRGELRRLGFDTGGSECHIVPIIVGDNARTLEFSRRLQEGGVAAVAVRPPTVPEGSARIRLSLTAAHRDEDLEWALQLLAREGRKMGVV